MRCDEVLIVDDEADIRAQVAGILEDERFAVRMAAGAREAEAAVRQRTPSLVLLDIWLKEGERDGMALLRRFVAERPGMPVVMISGHGTIQTAVDAIRIGAYDFIEKPFEADRLLLVARRAVKAALLQRENQELKAKAPIEDVLVGRSAAMMQLLAAVQKVAATESRVLVTGPAGVGKEVVARHLHRLSQRAAGPFVVINAATMAPERIELELFGAEWGERTPAAVGLFERAHGGTLLLDNVADMPRGTQSRILRALQEQTFLRVGGTTPVEVDVRVVATANRPLEAEIALGTFREDLFYRLNVVPLRVPPLAERRDDIALLCRHFVRRAAGQQGLAARRLAADAMAALEAADWPGNVRQLRNVIDWLLIMSPGENDAPVTAAMLPPEVVGKGPMAPADGVETMAMPLREAREAFERRYLVSQLRRFGGNISRTAAFVGMERSALHRKLKGLGVGERAPARPRGA